MTSAKINQRIGAERLHPSSAVIFLSIFTLSNYFSPTYYVHYSLERFPFFIGCLAVIMYVFRQIFRREPIFRINFATVTILLVLACSAYATFVKTSNYDNSFETLVDFSKAIVLFFLVSNILDTVEDLLIYLLVVVVCSFGLAFQLSHYPIWQFGRAFLEGSSLTTDPNGISAVLIYSLPLAIAMLIIRKSLIVRLMYSYFVWTYLLGIIEAQSRGGFLALITSALVLFQQLKENTHRLIAIGTVIVVGIPMAMVVATPGYKDRISTIFESPKERTGSAEARANAMEIAFNYVMHSPFSEFGLGNHSYLIAREYGEEINSPDDFKGSLLAHNMFLQFGADAGFIPLIFYIMFISGLFMSLTQAERKFKIIDDDRSRQCIILVSALRVSLCGYLAGSFFLPWAYDLYLFYVGGICLAMKNISIKIDH